MDIRMLEYFSEVAKHLSFTKAASSMHVSQPSISKAIKNLEDELGVPLFYRSSKQLELTDAGSAVLVNAKNVLDAFYNLTGELHDLMELKSGEIRIGIPPIIGTAFFSKLIGQFKEAYPLIHISLSEVGTIKIKQGIEEGTLDIGLVCNIPKEHDVFEVIRLVEDPIMFVANKQHPLAARNEVSLEELQDEPFILYRKDFSLYDRIIAECKLNGFLPNIVCESSQIDFMTEMVHAKLGIALLPKKICSSIINPNLVSLPVSLSGIYLEPGLIWKKNKYLPFAVREFINMARKLLETK